MRIMARGRETYAIAQLGKEVLPGQRSSQLVMLPLSDLSGGSSIS